MAWSGGTSNHFAGGTDGNTFYATFDPASDNVGELQQVNNNHDMFCPGIASLANGDYIIAGGATTEDGGQKSSTLSGSSFTAGPDLNINRGYNSAVTTQNGRVRLSPHCVSESKQFYASNLS